MVEFRHGPTPVIEFQHQRTIDVPILDGDGCETVRIRVSYNDPDSLITAFHAIGSNHGGLLSKLAEAIGARPVCDGNHVHVSPEAVAEMLRGRNDKADGQ